jgi:hypothetical protein
MCVTSVSHLCFQVLNTFELWVLNSPCELQASGGADWGARSGSRSE